MYNNGNTSKNVTGASVVDGSLASADFADDGLSGDKIDGGTISNFTSTGIDDNATSTAITINASEYVGINVTSPDSMLDIESTAYSTTALTLRTGYTGGSNDTMLVFKDGSGDQCGNIYINPTSNTTGYATSSDYRLKENVVPMTGAIDRLKELKPSNFNFKKDTDKKVVDGFLAHEAQSVVPECVYGTKDAMKTEEYEVTPAIMEGKDVVTEAVMGEREVPDYQGIDQSKLVPLLVGALQEAIARIETLENT